MQLIFNALKIMPVTCENIEPFHFTQHKYERELASSSFLWIFNSHPFPFSANLETIFKDQMYA